MRKSNKERQRQKAFYQKTQQNANAGRRDLKQPIKKRAKSQASPEWYYKVPAVLGTIAGTLAIWWLLQNAFAYILKGGFWKLYGPTKIMLGLSVIVVPLAGAYLMHLLHALWANNNAMFLSEDIEEYTNDAYVRTPDHIIAEFDAAPDAGLGFDGHAMELYKFSNVPMDFQKWYDATQYAFNEKNSKKEAKHGNARKGAFGRKAYDTLADYINGEFYPLETDTQRPAGVYFYDSRPVNTILIAITRGGKGFTIKVCPTC